MTVSIWQDRSSEMVRDVDVAVVGAGVVGCAIAREVSRQGRTVAILEARALAGGATGRSAGFVLSGLVNLYHRAIAQYGASRARELWELTLENRSEVVQVARRHDLPLDRCGSMLLAVNDLQAAELERAAAALEVDGFRVAFSSSDPLRRGFTAAVHWPDDLGVDPVRLTEALYRDSRAILYDSCEVFAMVSEADFVSLFARRGTFRARHVLLATNAYTPLLIPELAGMVTPCRAQLMATEPLPRLVSTLGYADEGYYYFRQTLDGRLLVGGGRRDHHQQERTWADHTTPEVQGALERFMARYLPEAVGKVTRRWAGTMGFSIDGLPLVGQLEADPRVSYAIGFTGHGLGLGLVTARRAVAMAFQGTHPGVLWAGRLRDIA